ncbi:MAG: glycine betaine ABC transporter substrate-binding protein [Fusobacterium sp.]|nr:glycine betaine ABC transporter substrate-binding protein [Fusobacterium sp.]
MNFLNYLLENKEQVLTLLVEHINLTVLSVTLAVIIGVPLGVLISHFSKINKPIMMLANVIQAIPTMALLGFLIPFLGIGVIPSVFMVVLYSLLPIIKNTYTSISGINPQIIEAAEGIGMTRFQILFKVQIPMALPIIMAGVRISAVTAVGLMTIAAFVGAGGLGYLVFSGIRTANNLQILAGAVPACILALFIDFIASIVEKAVVPEGINLKNKSSKKGRLFQKSVIGVTLLFILYTFINMGVKKFTGNKDTIVVASKDYTEQELIGNMLATLIESKTDYNVERKLSLGGTQVAFGALKAGEVDIYMEYTGTLYSDMLKYNPLESKATSREIFEICKKEIKDKFDVNVGEEWAFNNTYRLAVRKETAQKYNLKTVSDLSKVSQNMIISPTLEFTNRHDGLPGLQEKYRGLKFKDVVSIDGAPRYQALSLGESDVIDAFSTDGLIKTYDLAILEDDKEFFLPYHAVPIAKEETLEKYPELIGITDVLKDIMTDEVMRELNYQVDVLKKDPREVADEFLKKQNLI